MEKIKLRFDEDVDILDISKGVEVKHSMDIDDFVFDLDFNDKIVGVEILWASKNLHMTQEQLKNIQNASMEIKYLLDKINIKLKIGNYKKIFNIPIEKRSNELTITENLIFAVV